MADYDQAITLDPTLADAYLQRGHAYREQGNLASARADYDQAIAHDPNSAEAYYNRGLVRASQDDLAGAVMDLKHYLELRPEVEDREAVEAWIQQLEAGLDDP